MTGLILLTAADSLLYCAFTSVIRLVIIIIIIIIIILIVRFIYVRSSLQENIQRVLKRNSFTFSFLVIGVLYRWHANTTTTLDKWHLTFA